MIGPRWRDAFSHWLNKQRHPALKSLLSMTAVQKMRLHRSSSGPGGTLGKSSGSRILEPRPPEIKAFDIL
jgi:hypothetical protein